MMAVNIKTGYHRGVNKNAPAGKIIEKRGDLFVVSPSAVYQIDYNESSNSLEVIDEIYYDISPLGFEITNMEHLQISDDGQ